MERLKKYQRGNQDCRYLKNKKVYWSGVSILLSPFDLPNSKQIGTYNASLVVDIPVMLGVMLILTIPPLIKGRMTRLQGIILLAIYAAFCIFQFAL